MNKKKVTRKLHSVPSAELHIVYQCQAFKNWVVVLCNVNEEILCHTFFECSPVKAFWEYFVDWWTDVADEKLTMTLKDVILGWECRRSNCSIHFIFFGVELKFKKRRKDILL